MKLDETYKQLSELLEASGVTSFTKDPEKMSTKDKSRIKEIENRLEEIDAETHILNLLDRSNKLSTKEIKEIYATIEKESFKLADERKNIYKDNDINVKYHLDANTSPTIIKFSKNFIKHLKQTYGKFEDKNVTFYINKIEKDSSSNINETYNYTAKLLGERYEGLLVESSKQDVEEFKKDLKEKFFKKFKGLLDAKSVEDKELNFSLESALYWFGNDYHSGQSDIWYAVMSSSEYRPGRSEGSIEDTEDNDAQMFYDFLETDQKRKEKRVDESAEKKYPELKDGDSVWYYDGRDWSKGKLISDELTTSDGVKFYYVGSFARPIKKENIRSNQEMIDIRLEKTRKEVYESAYEKSLKPFINIKVTYNDGSVYKTQIRLTLEEAKKYYMGMGNVVSWEDEETGKEYKHKAVKVELDESVQLKESESETYFRLNDLKKLLISKEISIEDWTDRDGTPGFTMFLKRYNGHHTQFTKPVTKEEFENIQNKLLKPVSGKIWTLADMRNFIKSDKDLEGKVACLEFVQSGPGEYDSEVSFFEFKNMETYKTFWLKEPLDNKELKMFLLKKTK